MPTVPGHPAGGNLCESQASGGGCTAGCQAYHFDEKGLLVTTGGERQHLPWNRLRVTKQPGMVLVLSGAGSGYMLTNRVLGADREAFWSFVQSKVEQNR